MGGRPSRRGAVLWSIVSFGLSVGPYPAPAILGVLLVASVALALCARKFVFKKLK